MSFSKVPLTSFILLLLAIVRMPAQVLFSDGFESYTDSNNPLDKNVAGPNSAPNGSGNPWFGPVPPNLRVVGSGGGLSSGVAPTHSGNNMVTASAASDFDQDWANIAYRAGGGNPFFGNVALDWWFYDPTGSGNVNFRDYAALAYYSAAPGNNDYGTDSNLNHGSVLQRLSLGASNPAGFNANNYQARVVGATDGLGGGQWFNVGARSIGWHEGTIRLGAPNGTSTMVSFFIDGIDVLDHAISTANGVNVIELNDGFGSTVANYDDVSLSAVPEPGTMALLLCGGLTWLGLRRRQQN